MVDTPGSRYGRVRRHTWCTDPRRVRFTGGRDFLPCDPFDPEGPLWTTRAGGVRCPATLGRWSQATRRRGIGTWFRTATAARARPVARGCRPRGRWPAPAGSAGHGRGRRAEAAATGEHLLVQAGTGTGKSLAYLVPGHRARGRHRPARRSSPRQPWRCRPRSSTATCPASPRRSSRSSGAASPGSSSRAGATTSAGTRRWGLPVGRRRLFDLRPGAPAAPAPEPGGPRRAVRSRGRPAAGVGDGDAVGRPRRAGPGSQRPRLAPGGGERAGVPGRPAVPAGVRVLQRAGPRAGPRGGRRRHQPCPRGDRHLRGPADAARARPARASTRATSSPTGSPPSSPTSSARASSRRRRGACGQAGVSDGGRLDDAGALLAAALAEAPEGRLALGLPEELAAAAAGLRDAARDALTALKADGPGGAGRRPTARGRRPRAAVTEVHGVAERLASGAAGPQGPDVAWVSRIRRPDGGTGWRCTWRRCRWRAAAAAAVRRAGRRADVGDAGSRRLVRAGRGLGRAARRERPGLARARRRQPVRLPAAGHPLRRPAPAAAGAGRASRRPRSTNWRRWSQAAGGRTLGLFSSRRAARARGRASCGSGSTCRCCARARTPRRRWCGSSPGTRAPACSGRCPCGRGSTCRARRASSS